MKQIKYLLPAVSLVLLSCGDHPNQGTNADRYINMDSAANAAEIAKHPADTIAAPATPLADSIKNKPKDTVLGR